MHPAHFEFRSLEEIQAAFLHTAAALCGEIESFRPDLVIALAHSGWLPVLAARERWQSTHRRPFPACIRTNIGREKTALLKALPGEEFRINWGSGVSDRDAAYLLHQAQTRIDWVTSLRLQADGALGKGVQPVKILIVDEFSYSGKTAYLVLDLVEHAFPGARIHLVSANLDGVGEGLMRAWLAENHPEVLNLLPFDAAFHPSLWSENGSIAGSTQIEAVRQHWHASLPATVHPQKLQDGICALVSGTEDVSSSGLEWQIIDRNSSIFKKLLVQLPSIPIEQWLQLPVWVEKIVTNAAVQQAQLCLGAYSRRAWLAYHLIRPELRILQRAFSTGTISVQEAANASNVSRRRAAHLLSDLVDAGDLFPAGQGSHRRYHLSPNMFGEPTLAAGASLAARMNAFWLIPGRWLLVPHLAGAGDEDIDDWLVELKVNHFIYMEKSSRDHLIDYRKRLEARWGAPISKVRSTGLNLTFYPDTDPQGLSNGLKVIQDALKRGDVIVLTEDTSPQRAGMLAAAYLVAEGKSPEQAFKTLANLRAGLPDAWRLFPPRAWMRTLVRRWARLYSPGKLSGSLLPVSDS